ncbi:MAG TPA: hypothetical protein VD902_02930 [Symbiobacteriaceae bacterium]|nr:hypothetical protein [Symbiobacteriaceae bacterium]
MSSLNQTTTGLTISRDFRCVSGVVNLFIFITAPPPGSVIATIDVMGTQIPLVQTQPAPAGTATLPDVNRQFATVCGPVVNVNGMLAIDVRIVNPTGLPQNLQLQIAQMGRITGL